jgi:hypothetical protein
MKITIKIWNFLVGWAEVIAESRKNAIKRGYHGYY